MPTDEFCLGKAEECEQMAARTVDHLQREQWLKMAKDWRSLMRRKPESPKKPDQPRGARAQPGRLPSKRSAESFPSGRARALPA